MDALAVMERARGIREAQANANPRVVNFQNALALCYLNIGAVQSELNRKTEALESYSRARMIQVAIVKANPENPLFRSFLAGTLNNTAAIYNEQARWSEARVAVDEALGHQRSVIKISPRNPAYRSSLLNQLDNSARAFLGLRNAPDAADAARELASASAGDADMLFKAAGSLACCMPLAADRRQASRYGDEAMAVLKQAVAAGWTNANGLDHDPHSSSIRDREDFQKLLLELFDKSFPADPFAR